MFAPCQEKEEMMPKGTQLTFIFTFTFTGGSSIEGGRWGRYKQLHIQRRMGPNRWLIIHAIHYIHIKVMPENANAVNQLYNCVKLPAVIVQVYQPLKCSLAKSHSRQGRKWHLWHKVKMKIVANLWLFLKECRARRTVSPMTAVLNPMWT